MNQENRLPERKRRTKAEVQQLVREFIASGINRVEFCKSRGLAVSILDRHLREQGLGTRGRKERLAGRHGSNRLVPVELAITGDNHPKNSKEQCSGVTVILGGNRKIEVQPGFNAETLARLMTLLEST